MKTRFQKLLEQKEFLAAGLMSGTSMDGVDAALVRMPASTGGAPVELVSFHSAPYPEELKVALRNLAYGEQCSAEDIAVLNTSVAVAFSNSFYTACHKAGVEAKTVDFIGSHGQTIAHVPPTSGGVNTIAGTLQLGPPGMIAALTGVTTVGDFRVGDIALGGQGAPLAPYVDFLLRRSPVESRIILNIGGIANLTYLPQNGTVDEVLAFDTGPGNMVVDELYRAFYPDAVGFDKLVECLGRGQPSGALVESFLGHPYFALRPPKSAGHREFGGPFAWEFMSQAKAAGLSRDATLASAVLLTAQSIQGSVKEFIEPHGAVDQVYLTGGGAHNDALVAELERLLAPASVLSIDELGILADAKESVDFAVLGREALLSRTNVIPRITGATKAGILGTIAIGSSS